MPLREICAQIKTEVNLQIELYFKFGVCCFSSTIPKRHNKS